MKTVNRKYQIEKSNIKICIIFLVVHSTTYSQNKLQITLSEINPNFAIPTIAVFSLFTFLLYAYMKQKNH